MNTLIKWQPGIFQENANKKKRMSVTEEEFTAKQLLDFCLEKKYNAE